MKLTLNKEQKSQFREILECLGESLDISRTQFEAAVSSYNAVGNHLSEINSNLHPYFPTILPQGSFLLGTMIQPINPDDDLDIDLVCQLTGKKEEWTQFDLKKEVGDQLKKKKVYAELLAQPDGRRCWTLKYRESSENYKNKYHMDILPAIVDHGYHILLEKAYSSNEPIDKLAIRITDKKRGDYKSETSHLNWLKCNPFGYGKWFFDRASITVSGVKLFSESVKPVPQYQDEKLPLQRIVQILKRHRDMLFNGDDDKPISIIITTLAARAYNKEVDVLEGLVNVVARMEQYIQVRFSIEHGKLIKWVENPVNSAENFADKWHETPRKEKNFFLWLSKVKSDLAALQESSNSGLYSLQKSFSLSFGQSVVNEAFTQYGNKMRSKRDSGLLKMEKSTGILGGIGMSVKQHNFEGNLGKE
ncbi:nucleotidyltransferase domain-containing protein [Litoribacter populi]|uniref:nucleotidyltransferase domain-containing protein n=1 Tax=Litoribacter populi TaxID=2598460 RepID=UPI00117CBA9C|nr:nucleotidyltransferase [Litoribacter populi]